MNLVINTENFIYLSSSYLCQFYLKNLLVMHVGFLVNVYVLIILKSFLKSQNIALEIFFFFFMENPGSQTSYWFMKM